MEWVVLGLVVVLWLISPIVLTVALIISRQHIRNLRQQLAQFQVAENALSEGLKATPPQVAPVEESLLSVDTVPTSSLPETVIKPPPVLPGSPTIAAPVPPEPSQHFTSIVAAFLKRPWLSVNSDASSSRSANDWRPAPPTAFEKALHTLSGWPKCIAPFLVQNIGWFIGGFCFITGALFLIVNTHGFVNALAVLGSLLAANAFLVWAGYQFRQQGDSLTIASNVLLALGMLLAPLVLALTVRLFDAGNGVMQLAGILILAGIVAAFCWVAHLSSALIDQTLRGRYPWLLIVLAMIQLAAPLAVKVADWRVLAALHTILFSVLGYSLRLFSREWLRRLFVDRTFSSYYVAGLLVYTAAVSFIHLSWVWPQPLPTGYTAPFLMALCGVLFPVDAAFKEWVHRYSFLSRFSFFLYALSVVAMVIAVQSGSTLVMLLTFGMGAVLYGWVTWQYRSLPPLYVLLVCVTGLYGIGILAFLPPATWALASFPGLAALLGLARRVGPRSRAIALQCLLSFGVLLGGLVLWSLFCGSSGWLGLATAGMAAGLIYVAVRLARALPDAQWRWDYADIATVLLAATAVACIPDDRWPAWSMPTAFGLLALAVLWIVLGIHDRRQSATGRLVFISGALFNIVMALAAGRMSGSALLGQPEPIMLLVLSAALLLWLSLGLRWQSLFYAMLVVVGAAGILLKLGYFPGTNTGLVQFALVLALWSFLWWLSWRYVLDDALPEIATDLSRHSRSVTTLIRRPLEQVMVVLWIGGFVLWSLRLLDGDISSAWLTASFLGMVSGVVLVGYFRQFRWVVLPWLLGLLGLMGGLVWMDVTLRWLGVAALLYVLLLWWLARTALGWPLLWRWAQVMRFTAPKAGGGCQQVEQGLHYAGLLVAALPGAAGFILGVLGLSFPELLPALSSGLLLFVLTGQCYRTKVHVWAILMTLVVSIWVSRIWQIAPAGFFGLGQPLANVVLSLTMAWVALGLNGRRAVLWRYWRLPLFRMSQILYLLALMGTVLVVLVAGPHLSVVLLLLCIALFPVLRPLPNAAAWRGLGLVLLLSAFLWSVVVQFNANPQDAGAIAIAWGYLLWVGSDRALPRWNSCHRRWGIAPTAWPLLGFFSVLFGVVLILVADAWPLEAASAGLALYCFLLLRNTAWPGVAWLAVGLLTLSGLSVSINWARFPINSVPEWMMALLWLNALWLLVRLWRRFGQRVAAFLRWRQNILERPLVWIPFAVLMLLLAGLFLLEGYWLWAGRTQVSQGDWPLCSFALLLVVSAGHVCSLRLTGLRIQVFLLSLLAAVLAVMLDFSLATMALPLIVALWNSVLLLAWYYGKHRQVIGCSALEVWVNTLPAVAVILLFIIPDIPGGMIAVTLVVLALNAWVRGVWQGHSFWFSSGSVLALAGSYAVWLLDTPFAWLLLVGLLPWYALQTILLYLVLQVVQRRLLVWGHTNTEINTDDDNRACNLNRITADLSPGLLLLSGFWLVWHGCVVVGYHIGRVVFPWHFGLPIDPLAAMMALLLLAGVTTVRLWQRLGASQWIYSAALWLGLVVMYGRLVVLGVAPLTPWDTGVLLAAAALASLLYAITNARPFYYLALLIPLLALGTIPWQLASSWTGTALLATALLYLSMATRLSNPLLLYLAILALNAAVYLWIPLWVEQHGLWQFYIVPAAVSVLMLLHLHRRELRPKVLRGAQLTALSALYAGAGLDVFLRPELNVFVLALVFALMGIALGIALRIQVFLYAGVTFLVLNVLGQLIRFYPEQGLGRALILLGLGVVITTGMVMFNLKREAILQRVRIARADLARWD
ncbi:MAG: hypothetical protein CSA09_01705 [Candidatus Contendobacter odensis]|uniref:Uncharacterized protein n=1 Tax=Candidatus Contendibacter odensensis TaxID=1400860 RepID=A0A2G6PG90_9GAMM|nr:MAG: hypothetical protein CSA09_01705 [Candidatus Contendobacter odensis]